jgi:hypothetical protein
VVVMVADRIMVVAMAWRFFSLGGTMRVIMAAFPMVVMMLRMQSLFKKAAKIIDNFFTLRLCLYFSLLNGSLFSC